MKQVKLSPLLFLLVFSYMLIEGSFRPLGVLGFSLLHELGHVAAIWLLGAALSAFLAGGRDLACPLGAFLMGASYWRPWPARR